MTKGDPIPIVLFTGVQTLARRLRSKGLMSACLKEPGEVIRDPEDLDFIIEYDPSNLELLERWAQTWPAKSRIVAVINRREKRVVEHAILNGALNRAGLTRAQASIMRDKLELRVHLETRAAHLNPAFAEIRFEEESLPLALPFVLKPRNFFKSQLIFPCETQEDWLAASTRIPRLLAEAQARHGVELKSTFLAEEFLSGRHFSVDAFIEADGRIVFTPPVALTLGRDWSIEDMHVALRSIPAEVDEGEERTLRQAVEELVSALELKASPLHVDLVLSNGRAYVLDAAPRIGGYRSEMMELAWGCSLDLLGLDLALGKRVSWEPKWSKAVAVLELFPPARGTLKSLKGLEKVKGLRSFRRLKCRALPGEEVGLARDGFRCPVFVVLCHEDKEIVEKEVQEVRRLLRVEVESR